MDRWENRTVDLYRGFGSESALLLKGVAIHNPAQPRIYRGCSLSLIILKGVFSKIPLAYKTFPSSAIFSDLS